MTREHGSAFLLKIADADDRYTTIAGLRATRLSINGDAIKAKVPSGAWRELLADAGTRSVSAAASGIFTGSAAEARLRSLALDGAISPYELSFESGERIRGNFLVTQLEYCGDFNGERNYSIALESSGEVTVQ